jgi:hypothetical protein
MLEQPLPHGRFPSLRDEFSLSSWVIIPYAWSFYAIDLRWVLPAAQHFCLRIPHFTIVILFIYDNLIAYVLRYDLWVIIISASYRI